MNINLNLDIPQLEKDIKKTFDDSIDFTLKQQIKVLCREPSRYTKGDEGGLFYQLMTEKIESKFLSTESQAFIDKYISDNWEKIMKEQLDKAMLIAAEHIARKATFMSREYLTTKYQ